MKKEKFWNRFPIIGGGLLFGAVSLVVNLLSVLYLDMAHVYDVVHILPVVGFLSLFPKEPNSQWFLVPIALIVDFLIGLAAGFLLKKMKKKDGIYLALLTLFLLVYFIAICFQWIPIL
ncbi:MAG: hypothetical protein RR906_03285 [Acetivibrio sp.]